MRTLRVELGERSYNVYVGSGLLERAKELIPVPPGVERVVKVIDQGLPETPSGSERMHARARLGIGLSVYGQKDERTFTQSSAIGTGPGFDVGFAGEAHKVAHTLDFMWRAFAANGIHKNDLLIAFGGGALSDIAGFAAATYHRGMPWVVIPTTLLAMVDASIGGKTAIDLPQGKNLVGAFHQPLAVISDVTVLNTLPPEQFSTGMAEVIKHGLIADTGLLDLLEARQAEIDARDPDTLETLVADAAAVKVRIVSEDETEQGARAFLNYGHTLGHAIETLDNYEGRTHGQAVAIGMMFVAHLAKALGFADRIQEHQTMLQRYGLPTGGAGHDLEKIQDMWQRDKKYDRGVRFVVLEDLGKPALVRDVPDDVLRAAYEAVR